MTAPISTQIHLVSRPDGWPTPEDFNTVAVPLEPLADGEVRVRNEFVSVDPYMRGRMNLGRSYVPPFELDQQITGAAVGRVVESRNEALPVGSPVTHSHGWSDIAQDHASTFQAVTEQPGLPLSVFLNILGSTGLTAYTGLIKIAHMREGDTVFISGAAGAVGTAAGQIAKLLGAGRVVGSAGSAEKVALVTRSTATTPPSTTRTQAQSPRNSTRSRQTGSTSTSTTSAASTSRLPSAHSTTAAEPPCVVRSPDTTLATPNPDHATCSTSSPAA